MRAMGYELTARQLLNIETTMRRIGEGGHEAQSERNGTIQGHHYTFWPDTVRALKRDGRVDEALALVLECVEAAERDAPSWGGGIPPWYTEAAGIIYRKRKEFAAEIAILQRYERKSPPRHRGAFSERIVKVQELMAKANI
jgi:hypothetical protein